ncbi:hypothetical protein [Deinococcus sedimenti]|uniref:WD40 repeat domain-containing protein n=1 Tax=Deinococcus sedimenti TaxID=1867090 RepID=A0ABQ2S044_9DEIO|nr:hypothetical protein [Deinococcus sedimenti]GGR85353.1 hypothetical protein GCM10008960_10490 [Deinococcus sedimenti]
MPSRSARLAATLLTGLLSSAGAVTLTVRDTPVLPGDPRLSDATWDRQGGVHACVGERLLSQISGGQRRAVWLGRPCEAVRVSPDATQVAVQTGQSLQVVNLNGATLAKVDAGTLSGFGFLPDGTLLLASARGLERLTWPGGERVTLDPTPVTSLDLNLEGTRAVLVRGARVQLIDTATLVTAAIRTLSGLTCDATCPPAVVAFSADGRSATAQLGPTLVALRDGFPSTTVLRPSDPEAGGQYTALPLRNNTVLLLRPGETQVRDIQTGHRERRWPVAQQSAQPARLSPQEDVLTLIGTTLTVRPADLTSTRPLWRLPGAVEGGAVDSTGTLITVPAADPAHAPDPRRWLAVGGAQRSAYGLTPSGLTELRGSTGRPLPAQAGATQLSVNHWGNHVVTWSGSGLSVTAPKSGTVIFSAPAPGLAHVTLSPDATRAYLFPRQGEPRVQLLANRKTFPLPVQPGVRYRDVQISGKGVHAYARPDGRTDLYRTGQRQPYASLPGGPLSRFSPDSLLLAVVTPSPGGWVVALVDAATGEERTRSGPLDRAPTFLAWSADSRTLHVGAGPLDGLASVTTLAVSP